MEDLNKNQIILLTLLVSFVTSIATGIMTVSLLNVAPVEVTRNINSIVEKTIEKVTPTDMLSTIKQKEITTIIVKEEDSITASINKNLKSIVRIREKDTLLNDIFYGIGLVISKDGLIAADRKIITATNIYIATMSDGVEFKLIPTGLDKKTNFILFKVNPAEVTEDSFSASSLTAQVESGAQVAKVTNKTADRQIYTFTPATLSDSEPKLGQTVVSIGGDISNAVSVGRVISLQVKDLITSITTTKYLAGIDTDVSERDLVVGSPILNLSGDIVGMKLSNDLSKSFTPISVLKKELPALMETSKTQ